jgi:hypothetical protein
MSGMKKTTKYEVRSEGDLIEADFTDRAEAEEFLNGLDDKVLELSRAASKTPIRNFEGSGR